MAETFIPDHKFDANDLRAIGALSATDLEVIDHARMAACKPRWLKLAMVVGEAIHACPEKYHDVPDIFYSQRVRELVKTVRSIDKMSAVSVQITRFVNDHFPGFVECVLSDALGKNHAFVEKAPIVSTENLSAASTYPCSGELQCEILREWQDESGLSFATVCTKRPWGAESTNGATKFTVFSSQLRAVGLCA